MIDYPITAQTTQHKGGDGKTTLTLHIGAAFALRGATVVMIDADPQGNLTQVLRRKKNPGLLRLLSAIQDDWKNVLEAVDPKVWAGNAVRQPGGELWIVPGHVHNRMLPQMLGQDDMFGATYMELRERLEELAGFADIVLIDTSPTPSMMHGLGYMAADHIIVPTQAEQQSLFGVHASTLALKEGQKKRTENGIAPYNLLGYQVNRFNTKLKDHRENFAALAQQYDPALLLNPITERTVWKEAASRHMSLFAFDAKGHQGQAKDCAIYELLNTVNHIQGQVLS